MATTVAGNPPEDARPPCKRRVPKSVDEVFEIFRGLQEGYVFRGHQSGRWRLQSSLERSGLENTIEGERWMLIEFPRRAAHYLPQATSILPGDTLTWLSILQHYGAPTRLLDWTHSPYVALFFAVEERLQDHDQEDAHVVWALSSVAVRDAIIRLHDSGAVQRVKSETGKVLSGEELVLLRQDFLIRCFVMGTFPPTVAIVEPWQPDTRQTAQQSVFVSPALLSHSFEENLAASGIDTRTALQRIEILRRFRPGILAELRRMNVTSATLFPGLDGYARSFRTALVAPTHEERVRDALLRMIGSEEPADD
jgi:hypothetical protein